MKEKNEIFRIGEIKKETKTQPTLELISWLKSLDGQPLEEIKRNIVQRYAETDKTRIQAKEELAKLSAELEEQHQTWENLADVETSVSRVMLSLSEHMKTLRMNENSLAVNAAVLEYESAKTRSTCLRKSIAARKQFEKARESLKDVPHEDKTTMLTNLQQLQNSIDVLKKCVPGASVNAREVEEQKDAFLAWQSTALFLGLQQGDAARVADIYNTYSSLDRKNEFIGVFSQGVCNRFKNVQSDMSAIGPFLDGICREIEAQFAMYFNDDSSNLGFLDQDECLSLVSSAIRLALIEFDFKGASSELIGAAENPIDVLNDLWAKLDSMSNVAQRYPAEASSSAASLLELLKGRFLEALETPLSNTFCTCALSRVNTIDLTSGSHRARVTSFMTTSNDLAVLLHDMLESAAHLYPEDTVKTILQKPFDVSVDNIVAKIKNWNYSQDSQGRTRPIDDLIKVCEASGQFISGLARLKTIASSVHESFSVNSRAANKWNSKLCEKVLHLAAADINSRLQAAVAERKAAPLNASSADLPAFSLSPSEYITSVAQELLQQFHKFEMFLSEDNTAYAFSQWCKKHEAGEDLFMHVMAELASLVTKAFVLALGDIPGLPVCQAKQFSVDAEYLREALVDLRVPSVHTLDDIISQLSSATRKTSG